MLIGFSLGLSFRVCALFLSSEVRAACTFLSFLMNKNIRYSILALTEVSPTDILRDEKTFVSQEVFWENQIKYNVPTFLSLFWTEKKNENLFKISNFIPAVDYIFFGFRAGVVQDPLDMFCIIT